MNDSFSRRLFYFPSLYTVHVAVVVVMIVSQLDDRRDCPVVDDSHQLDFHSGRWLQVEIQFQ